MARIALSWLHSSKVENGQNCLWHTGLQRMLGVHRRVHVHGGCEHHGVAASVIPDGDLDVLDSVQDPALTATHGWVGNTAAMAMRRDLAQL